MKTDRPDVVDSKTHKIEVACGHVFVTIGLKDKTPVEIFIAGSKSGGCKANQEAIGRLTSTLLQNNLLSDVIDQLKGIMCNACSRKKGELAKEERKNFPCSCGDAIGRILEKYDEKRSGDKS